MPPPYIYCKPKPMHTLWDWPNWWVFRRPVVRILVVIDGSVGADPGYFFGVGKMIEILRKSAPHNDPDHGFVRFDIKTATRDPAPVIGTVDYPAFRFDAVVGGELLIDKFDQIWCFGFHPGNSGQVDDAPIDAHATKVQPVELQKLTTWMNVRGGGVLAMGDHHFLGATLAWNIPRVRAMRRWTNVDGVPPIDSPIQTGAGPIRYRHDTNQPQNALQADPASTEQIPNDAERDGIPQKIKLRYFGIKWRKRPHPILCSQHGEIDVLPDHPHEGWIYEDTEIREAAAYDWGGGVAGRDFPDAVDGGARPLPQAIAWARPYPEPPYDHQKTSTEVEQFAVIGAYDGHRANVGRVVVDSTWHHWFNMNIDGLQAAAESGGADQQLAWNKIKSYFRNVAVWLSPPGKQLSMLNYAAFWSLGDPLAVEGYDAGMPSWELGETAKDILGQWVTHCQLYDWLLPFVPVELVDRFRDPRELLPPQRGPFPPGPECLTCPPWRLIENAALGGIIKAMLPERERMIAERLSGKTPRVDADKIARAVEPGAAKGLSELRRRWQKDLEHAAKTLAQFEGPSSAAKRNVTRAIAREDLAVFETGKPEK